MTIQTYVDSQIKLVCPILGVRFVDLNDKSTWIIQYDESVTPEQIAAAEAFLAAFVWDEATQEIDRKRERDARYINAPIYKAGFRDYLVGHPDATFCDYMDSLET